MLTLAAIVGGWYAGGAIGALCTGWVADRIGRRKTLQGLALVALVASILQTAAVHVSMMLLGRVLVGAA
jgi:MFS family permease